ncbi:hypothetical protein LOTGIDRAFT_239223 [Lottia gigantea]|uniref:Uncharacterized protein n=1 Tax=Lottia gigantea TaxID=225164 RepID=V4C5Z3_LOTGI|nr:hypothetical protein LOTGIDRAFT_239223 [Lottia gigantea]ESO97039.1 hypothetical protein LOTGIDRAFT_239223 [Lottia gigantea]
MDILTFILFLVVALIPIFCYDLDFDYFVTHNSSVTWNLKSLMSEDLKNIIVINVDKRGYRTKIGNYSVNDDTWKGKEDVRISNRTIIIPAFSKEMEAVYELEMSFHTKLNVKIKYFRLTSIYDPHLCCNGRKSMKWTYSTLFDRKLNSNLTNCTIKIEKVKCTGDFEFGYLDVNGTNCTPLNIIHKNCNSEDASDDGKGGVKRTAEKTVHNSRSGVDARYFCLLTQIPFLVLFFLFMY